MTALLLAAAAAGLQSGPVDFAAAQMRIDSKERRVFLDGEVKLVRGDLTIDSDHAIAFYAPQKSGTAASPTGQNIDRFTVDGNVRLQRATKTAQGSHGDLDLVGQTMLLTGTQEAPPVVREREETLSGDRILMRLDNDDVEVQKPRLVLRRALPEEKERKDLPLRVEAAHLFVDKARQVAHFDGNVVVHREDLIVKSPRMDALYDKDGQLTHLELRGGVDLREGDRHATGQSADYEARKRVVALTGDPRLYDRGDVLVGDRIDMALDSKEVFVERARGRVRPDTHKDEVEAHR
jgi:lipopolysaccharide transport protein LptA